MSSDDKISTSHLVYFLLGLLAVEAVVVAIDPLDRKDWLLENILVLLAVPLIIFSLKKASLSHGAYLMLFLFLYMHELGSHYTYALVPYKSWLHDSFGMRFSTGRNNYDRLVHFLYGFLLTIPLQEIGRSKFGLKGFWAWFTPVNTIMSTSMIYELIEWAVAVIFGGNLGVAYLGTQGDVWDAQQDMAMASLGSILITLIFYVIKRIGSSHKQEVRNVA